MKLNYYLTSSFNELVLFTLKLYVALSNFGSGQVRKVLLDEFAWDLKVCLGYASLLFHKMNLL